MLVGREAMDAVETADIKQIEDEIKAGVDHAKHV